MLPVLVLIASVGAYLLVTSTMFGKRDLFGADFKRIRHKSTNRSKSLLRRAGLDHLSTRELVAVPGLLFFFGASIGYIIFASPTAALAVGVIGTIFPLARARSQRLDAKAKAMEAWPRLIEEIRVYTGSVGMSVPQALFEAGRHAPEVMRPAFRDAEREWLLTTDFDRTTALLKSRLQDPTADATCETLLVAHRIGGNELGNRLHALVEDRIVDVQGRKDARSKQAGARFARRFVLIVPFGMALAGLSIGSGRAAYQTPIGQTLVIVAFLTMGLCWMWAGRMMRLPEEDRVFQ